MVSGTELHPPRFSTNGFREFGNKLDFARIFIGGDKVFAVGLEFGNEVGGDVGGGAKNDEGLDDLATEGIGFADNGDIDDSRVFKKSAFDFERADAIAGAFDDVVLATDKPEVAVFVAGGAVAGVVPMTSELAGGFFGVKPVFTEEAEGTIGANAEGDFAFGARR